MKILAFDTSTSVESIALSDEGKIIAEHLLHIPKTHSETLLPAINRILMQTDTKINEIDAVAVAEGPGSFTGLRIGLASAKGICYAQKIPLIPIPTLLSLANNILIDAEKKNICPILSAGRGEFYTAIYSAQLDELIEPQLLSIEELCEQIKSETVFVGPDVEDHKHDFGDKIKVCYQIAPSHLNYPRASSLIDIIHKRKIKSKYDYQYTANVKPLYIRQSSAEERFQNPINRG